ncbi:MAG: EAL domain-containing protein [Acidimicrobiales bacterium]|nr:EAL domain-containing protein [Acidimicrobiales bacterium]
MAAVLLLAIVALLPWAGPNGPLVALVLAAVGLPYNFALYQIMKRTSVLTTAMAFADQVLAVLVLALAPDLMTPVLLVMFATNASAAVAFGRKTAWQSSVLGFIGAVGVALAVQPDDAVPALVTYGIADAALVVVVGGVSELERDLRWRYAELMGGIDAIVWEQIAQHPSRLYVNRRAEELFGYPATAWQEPGFWREHVHPDDLPMARRAYREAIRKGQNLEIDYRMIAADGRVVYVHDRMRVETDEFGRATNVRGVMLDVTAERQAQQQAHQYVDLVENIRLALVVLALDDDEQLRVQALNPEAASVLGISQQSAKGRRFLDVIELPDAQVFQEQLADVIRTGEGWILDDFRVTAPSPSARVYTAYAFPLPGDAVGLSLQDVTERTMAAEVLRRQALHDGLTGLPNRTLLNDRLRQALTDSAQSGHPVSLLMMDLDQFKEVNDALGHDHGDRLLIEMSRRLQKLLRKADTIARLGGDEFAVLLTTNADTDRAMSVARQIRAALEQPFQLGGITLQSNASIGIATYPDHGEDAETLIQRADVAMYVAKRGGLGVAVYSPEHDQSSVRRLALLGELRQAIQDNQLVLYHQPSLDLREGRVVGVESLVRWQHPEHGLMPPGEFIELAELSGVIQPLTRWVIDAALRQASDWNQSGLDLVISINLSVRNLYDRDLVPWIQDLLKQRSVPPSQLKIEITESELMDDPMLAMEVLGKLKGMGVSTSIDDFGTGYSSLAYLKHLPIDELKIDKSFVGNMINDDSDLTIVRSTIDLSHNLGLDVVAEGVEDAETLSRLAALGCDRAQGYFLSRPVPAEAIPEFLSDTDRLAALTAHLPTRR